ncbi:unnamed protein product [Moneuplotes crassus]|uniref:Uncharacterized protein n=1 Tax=Euplotes crassus TaxID=5936 RepID=A0AAD1YAL1_EUPCR|nr:unnamed protein product [Moneuplotes crassus]
MESNTCREISFPYTNLYLHHLQASLTPAYIQSQIPESEVASQIDEDRLKSMAERDGEWIKLRKKVGEKEKELKKYQNKHDNLKDEWKFFKSNITKEQKQKKYLEKHGGRMDTLKQEIPQARKYLQNHFNQNFNKLKDEEYNKILNKRIEQNIQRNSNFLSKTLKSNLYTLTCTPFPESCLARLVFSPITLDSQVRAIMHEILNEGPVDPELYTEEIKNVQQWEFEEAEIILDAQGRKEASKFFENTGIDHFCEVIRKIEVKMLDTLILKNFCFRNENLDRIISASMKTRIERIVFNNCRFKMIKKSISDSCHHEEVKGPKPMLSAPLKQKDMIDSEEIITDENSDNHKKKRALYGLSFINCNTSSTSTEEDEDMDDESKEDLNPNPKNQTNSYKLHSDPKTKKIHSMKSVILSIIKQIDSLKSFYKDRTLVSLTLKNLYLSESSITAIQDACPFLETFIVFDEPQES